MRALRFGVLALCVDLVACGGSSFELSEERDEAGADTSASTDGSAATDGSSTSDTDVADSATVDTATTSDTAVADTAVADTAVADTAVADTAVADTAVADTAVADTAVADTAVADTAVVDTGADAGCPALVLGGATEDVYVDKAAATGGNGTKTCPFKTILQATTLAAPGSATARTIHVKGNAAAPDYFETNALQLAANVTLTSNYATASDGAAASVRIVARGDCTALTGGTTTTYCAVGMNVASRLELVTVRSTAGVSTGHAVLTTVTLPTGAAPAPRIVDVNAENANESAIRAFGSVTIGPRVNATNSAQGLNAGRNVSLPQATLTILDAATLSGAPSNAFSKNKGNGLSAFGDWVITIDGLDASSNSGNGLVIGTPYGATSTTSHSLANIQAIGNTMHGLRLIAGEVKVKTGAFTNRFNGNGQYGVQLSVGDITGNARLILAPKLDASSSFLIGHEATRNGLGGVLLNQASPPGTAPSSFSSLNASLNGSAASSAPANGIYVQVVGANQPSLVLRGSTLLQNTGSGLRFQKVTGNSLDVGTAAAGGYNVWGDAVSTNRNAKSAVCFENLTGAAVTQLAELDRWSQSCPLPLGSGSFQANLGSGSCGSNSSYSEITYTGTVAPIAAVIACY